jgi:hypothetical protein
MTPIVTVINFHQTLLITRGGEGKKTGANLT